MNSERERSFIDPAFYIKLLIEKKKAEYNLEIYRVF